MVLPATKGQLVMSSRLGIGHYLDTRHAATPDPHLERDAQKG